MPTATKRKKNRGYRPSTLLGRALVLFGPRGQYWIQQAEHKEPGQQAQKPGKPVSFKVEKDSFCSIGATSFINTKREKEANLYLERAIAENFKVRSHSCNFTGIDDNKQALKHIGKPVSNIVSFNDRKGRQWRDIKRAFKAAIKLAKSEGN